MRDPTIIAGLCTILVLVGAYAVKVGAEMTNTCCPIFGPVLIVFASLFITTGVLGLRWAYKLMRMGY